MINDRLSNMDNKEQSNDYLKIAKTVKIIEISSERIDEDNSKDLSVKKFKNYTKSKKKFYECKFKGCDMIFVKHCILLDHERAHKGEKPFTCKTPGCNKSFTQLGNLKNHEKAHQEGRSYLCKVPNCNKSFTTLSYLKVNKINIYLLLLDS